MAYKLFSLGDLVAVATTRPEFNARVWKVEEFVPGPPGTVHVRITLVSADGLLDDSGSSKRISVLDEKCSHLAVVPLERSATQPSSTIGWAPDWTSLAPLAVPTSFSDQFEMLARFVFANRAKGSCKPLLDTWVGLPLLGGNKIMLRESVLQHEQQLVMYPLLDGYTLWFFSTWAQETIQLIQCDILKACPACQVWPWCAYCHRFLFPVHAHRASKKHEKCIGWCVQSVVHTRTMVTARLPHGF